MMIPRHKKELHSDGPLRSSVPNQEKKEEKRYITSSQIIILLLSVPYLSYLDPLIELLKVILILDVKKMFMHQWVVANGSI